MATPRRFKAFYLRDNLVADLKDTQKKVEAFLDEYPAKVAAWRVGVLLKFEKMVQDFDPDLHNGLYLQDLRPPERPEACRDWRVQSISRNLHRLSAMVTNEQGAVELYSDDEVFTLIISGDCL